MTPAICTIVKTRNSQSSVSNAEANQEKLIHAQMIAATAKANAPTAAPPCPATTPSANCTPATPNAAAKTRS